MIMARIIFTCFLLYSSFFCGGKTKRRHRSLTEQYRPTSYRVNATQYLASRRTGKLVLQPTTLSMSSHRSCIDRQIPSTGQTRHHHIAVVYERLPSSSASSEAITLCNDYTSENRTSFGARPCFVHPIMTLVICCCCGLAFSNIHHILQHVHLVFAVICTSWQACHYFLSEYNVAVALLNGSLLACRCSCSCRLSSLGLITSHRLTTFATNTPY